MKKKRKIAIYVILLAIGLLANVENCLAKSEYASAKCIYSSKGTGDLSDYQISITVDYTTEGKIKFSPASKLDLSAKVENGTCRYDQPKFDSCYKTINDSYTVKYLDMKASDFLDGHSLKGCPGDGDLNYYVKGKTIYIGWTKSKLVKALKASGISINNSDTAMLKQSSSSTVDFDAEKIKIYDAKNNKTNVYTLSASDEGKLHTCIYSDGTNTLTVKVNSQGKVKDATLNNGLKIRGTGDVDDNGTYGSNACIRKIYVQGCNPTACSKVLESQNFIKVFSSSPGGIAGSITFELDKKATRKQEKKDGQSISYVTVNTCEGMLTAELLKLLRNYYGVIIAGVIIALVMFGIFDFSKALTSGDESDMKKAYSKFVRRVVIAVVIILIPYILGMVLSIIAKATGNNYGQECISGFGQYTSEK